MRKRLTQIFPFLLPLRKRQRCLFYQIKLRLDKNKYAQIVGDALSYVVCEVKGELINKNSGYPMEYQFNKVHNVKMLSRTMHQILIYPGEVFSFCYLSPRSKRYGKYKNGLVLVDGKIVPKKGGGICQLSNLLYYAFLKSPLTIVERHAHKVKSLPNAEEDSLEGVDATAMNGWLDLKAKNNTDQIFQIDITFGEENVYVKILSNKEVFTHYAIFNENFRYVRHDNKIYECVSVFRSEKDKITEKITVHKLYDEIVEVTFTLPENVVIEDSF